MRRKQRISYEGIAPPQMPATPELDVGHDRPLATSLAYAGLAVANIDWSNQTADDLVFKQVVARRVVWRGTRLSSLQLVDARLEACDLAATE